MLLPTEYAAEEARIRAAYAQREARPAISKRESYFDRGCLFMMQEQERKMLDLLKRCGRDELQNQKILEVGCGTGGILRKIIRWGARPENVFGLDLVPENIEQARRLSPCAVSLSCGNAADIPHPDATFDMVVQVTAFSSILDPGLKQQIAREMRRVLKADGAVLWLDFFVNNPRNPEVRGIGRKEIRRLFPDCDIALRRVTPAPPLARLLAPYSWLLCDFLAGLAFLDTHYLGLLRPKPEIPAHKGL
jgi:ubiquinone/menaquinone biosynthesis C-methylase UbiE